MFNIAMMCEYGSEYKPCGPPCEQTCHTLSSTTISDDFCESAHCVEGCFCPNGTYRSGLYMILYIF